MSDWLLLVLVGAVGIVACVCAAALTEVFRQLEELRRAMRLDDQPMPLDLPSDDVTADDLGLPAAVRELPEAILVLLHRKCGTCRAVAEAFRGGAPRGVWFVIPEEDLASSRAFEALTAATAQVILDGPGGIAATLQLDVAPAVVTLRHGAVEQVLGVSTATQLLDLVPATDAPGLAHVNFAERR
jgi:hypothetical protein